MSTIRQSLVLKPHAVGVAILIALTTLGASNSVFAAWPNDKVIVTDLLDDDIRALINLFSDKKTGNTVKAIVVSTGNTQLKAEITRKIVSAFGLNIPVYAGTSTDLANNSVTSFAANFEAEGKHILDETTRWRLKERYGESGDGAERLAALIKGHATEGKPLDVLLLTAPTDLVTAIKKGASPKAS